VSYSSLTKVCPDCQIEKPVAAFSRNAARSDGLQFYCKECYSARSARSFRDRQFRRGKLVRERVEVPTGHKFCPGCREVSPLTNWHRNATSSDGYASYCKACRKEQGRLGHLKRTFGLEATEFAALVGAQGGLCAICRDAPVKHLDHNHETGAVRGGLCGPCNMGLGQFRDDPNRLTAAAKYLHLHRRVGFLAAVKAMPQPPSPLEEAIRRLVA
jgi:hypothetical protein